MSYIKSYSNTPPIEHIWGYDVPVPKKPPKKKILNWDLPKRQQKFYKTEIPHDLDKWNRERQDEFVFGEWDKRVNGVWVYINGTATYISGSYYYFLNYWTLNTGFKPDYRDGQRKFFALWEHVVEDDNAYGICVLKGRRFGLSAIAECIVYERASRIKNTQHFVRHKTEKESKERLLGEIVKAHRKMMWYFKPMHTGAKIPKNNLTLDKPDTSRMSEKDKEDYNVLEDEDGDIVEGIQSIIVPLAVTEGQGDGGRTKTSLEDEWAKTDVRPKNHWKTLKRTYHIENGAKIVGKALYVSTMEATATEKQLEWTKEFFNDGLPSTTNNGRTKSGLISVLITADEAAEHDEFGMPMKEKYIEQRREEIERYYAEGDGQEAISLQRLEPMSISDCFQSNQEDALLDPKKLQTRAYQLRNALDADNNPILTKTPVRTGWLKWKDNGRDNFLDMDVEFFDDPSGPVKITQMPDEPNKTIWDGGLERPANIHEYCAGIDPYDHRGVSNKKSDGAIVIFRRGDLSVDGNDIAWSKWSTCKWVCIYNYRQADPLMFFEDCLKLLKFYGCQGLPESNKPGILNWFDLMGKRHFMQVPAAKAGKVSGKKQRGLPSNEKTISIYSTELMHYVAAYGQLIDHIEIINELLTFNPQDGDNRRTHDLAIACAFSLLANMKKPTFQEKEAIGYQSFFKTYELK
jgi:hypothetical protein